MFVSLYNENHSQSLQGQWEQWAWEAAQRVEHLAVWACSFYYCSSVPLHFTKSLRNLDNTSLPVSRVRAPSSVPQQWKQPFYLGDLPGSRNRQGNCYVKLVWGWLKPTWTGLKWNNNLILSPVSLVQPLSILPASASGSVVRYGFSYKPEIKIISSLDIAFQLHQSSSVQLLVAELQVEWMGLVWQVCAAVVVGVCSWAEQGWVRSSQWRC